MPKYNFSQFAVGDWVELQHIVVASREYRPDGRQTPPSAFLISASPFYRAPAREREREYRYLEAKQLKQPVHGQIIGATYRAEGFVFQSQASEDDYEPGYLAEERRVLVWQVRLGLTNTPIEVTADLLTKLPPSRKRKLPVRGYYSLAYRACEPVTERLFPLPQPAVAA